MPPLVWGVIGAGDIVRRRVAPAIRESPLCEFLAVTRARAELSDEARTLGAWRWYARWPELVADPHVQAVYVATPVHVHAEHVIAAAEAGRHVLCEKPMAMNVAECDRMIAACRASGVKLGIAYYRHFYPVIARIKELLAAGTIGRPVFAEMRAFEWFDPPADHPRAWLLQPAIAGGGPMIDFGCHRVEVLINLFGSVDEVAGLTANVAFARDVEDTAGALLRFENGPVASLVVSHAAIARQDTLQIVGTGGSIHCDDLNAGVLRIVTQGAAASERRETLPPAANVHRPLIDDFVEAVIADREPAVNGEAGRAVTAVVDRIYAGSAHRRSTPSSA